MIFKNVKWVMIPLIGCTSSVIIMIGLLGYPRMESYSDILKLYCVNVDIKYGNEHSYDC